MTAPDETHENLKQSRENRDLLVELRTTVAFLVSEFKDFKDNLSVRVALIEKTKLDVLDAKELQKDVESLKEFRSNLAGKYVMLGIVGTILVSVVTAIITHYFVK